MGDMRDTGLLPCGAFVHDTLEVNLSTERKRWDEAVEICSENGQDLSTDVDIIKNCVLELKKNSRKQIVGVWSSRTQTNARRCRFIEYDGEEFSVKSSACTQRRSFVCYSEITEPTQTMTFPKTTKASPAGSQPEMKQTATAGMSGAAIGGLVAGLLVLFAIIIAVIILLLKRRKFSSLDSPGERKRSKKFYRRWYSIFLKKTRRKATPESVTSENQPPEVDRTSLCAIYTEILPLEDHSPGNLGHGTQNNQTYELPDAANTENNVPEIESPNVYEVPVMGDDPEGRYDELQLSEQPNSGEQHTYFELEKSAGADASQSQGTGMSVRNSVPEWDGPYELAQEIPDSSDVIDRVEGQGQHYISVEKSDNNVCHNQTGTDHVYNNDFRS